MDSLTESKIVFGPNQHSFFDDLVTMTFSIFAIEVSVTTFGILNLDGMKDLHRPADDVFRDLRRPFFSYEQKLTLNINSTGGCYGIVLMDVQPYINLGHWPLHMEVFHYPQGSLAGSIYDLRSAPIYRKIVGASFVSYYESQLDHIESRYTKTTANWPPIINFARVVRNGVAHGGKLAFKQSKVPVSWKKWTFGPSDDGEEFLLVRDGLDAGDIVLLFQEIHAELYP